MDRLGRWRLWIAGLLGVLLLVLPAGASARIRAAVSVQINNGTRIVVKLTGTTPVAAARRPRAVTVKASGITVRLVRIKNGRALGTWRSARLRGSVVARALALRGKRVTVIVRLVHGAISLPANVAGAPKSGTPVSGTQAGSTLTGGSPAPPGDSQAVPPLSPGSSAVPVPPQGNWVGDYGGSGFDLAAWSGGTDVISMPTASVSLVQGGRIVWGADEGDVRELESADRASRVAAAYLDPNELQVRLDFSAPYAGKLALYALDFDHQARRETITVGDQAATLSSDFSQGSWNVFQIDAAAGENVTIKVDRVSGPNAVLSGLFLGGASPTPLGVGGDWSLKFDDEFSASSLDLTKWQPNWLAANDTDITSSPNHGDLNCVDPAQVTEGGGVLSLAAVQQPCPTNQGATDQYASGLVNTRSSYMFTYGYFEARIYLPADSSGTPTNFPAFWAVGTGTWPTTGELDVMEVLHSCGPGVGYHFQSDAGNPGGCATLPAPSGWHTFGADWAPGLVTYYVDGRQVGQITSGITNSPMYLILDNCVDPTYGGSVLTPASMLVDYIRVWQ